MIIDKALILDKIELKPLREVDVSDKYVSWLNNPDIVKYTEARFLTHTLQGTKNFVQRCNLSDSILLLGIFYEGKHIGNIKSDINIPHKTAGIGLIIGEKLLHGIGIGGTVINVMCSYLFSTREIYKINAGAYVSNTASIKAFQKVGFKVEYTKYKHVKNVFGEREDIIMMVRYAN